MRRPADYRTPGFNAVLTVLYFLHGRPASYAEFAVMFRSIYGRNARSRDLTMESFSL